MTPARPGGPTAGPTGPPTGPPTDPPTGAAGGASAVPWRSPAARLRRDPLVRAVRLLEVRPGRVAAAVLAGAGSLGSAVALAAVSAWLIARASQMPPVMHLTVAAVAVRTFGVSRGLLRYVERLVSHDVALRGMATLRTTLYRRLSEGDGVALLRVRRGDLLARVGADVDAIGDVVVRGLLPAGVAAVVGAGGVALLAAFLPAAGVALAACLLVAGVLAPWLAARGARRAEQRSAASRAEVAATAATLLDGAAVLTVAGRVDELVDRLRDADARTAHAADDGARPASLAAALQPAATGTAVLAALVLGAHATAAGTLAPVELAVVVLTPLAAFEAVALLPAAALQVLRSRAAAERVMALLEPATTADDGVLPGPAAPGTGSHVEGPRPDPGSAAGPADGSSSAPGRERPVADAPRGPRLVARGADVGWPGGPTLVRGLDLELSPGRSVAVVGPSGLGKTTLLLTLAGLLRPHAGHVTLDGVDVADLGRAEAARSVVVVPEDAHVFDTTVLENLRVARGDVTAAEATSTLEAVGLGAWLDALPDGLATVLGADATRVSGGERRRLLLARALLSRAPLLLLDEPTEHVDAAGDDLMTALLDGSLAPGRGVVVVTHRTGGLDAADEVIALARTGSVSRARPRPRDGAARDRDAAQAARPAGPTA